MTVITQRVAARAALGLILAVALGWRLNNIGFGLPSMLDPDEPMFMITALKMLSHGTLNPGWFGHPGTTTIMLVAAIDAVVAATGLLTGHYANLGDFARAAYADPAMLFVPARVAMALIGTGCVWLTYLLGKRLNGEATGLIAAALLSINALHILWSQVIRTDINASLFMLACLLFAARLADQGKLRDALIAGAFAGLATATKWPAATVFIAIIGAAVCARQQPVRRILAAAAASLAAMFVASPFLFLDWRTMLANVTGEISPGHLGQNSHGFIANLRFYLVDQIGGSMGLIGLGLMLAGVAVLAVRNRLARWTLLPASAAFLILICTQNVIFARWLTPWLPMACIFAAGAIVAVGRIVARWSGGRARQIAFAALGLLVAIPSLAAAINATAERATDTRTLAAAWGKRHIPPGSRVVFEHLELSIRDQPWTILFPIGDAGCIDGKRALRDGVDADAVRKARGASPIVDLGHVAAHRLDTCRADFAILAYYDLYLVENDRYPAELATYRRLLGGGRTVAIFRPVAGKVGGPVVRILALPPR
ncbi:MAG: glycosyltransferase family 39 protein [Sphingomicrobium sp.]